MHLLHGGSIFLEGLLPCSLESAFYWTEQQKCFLVFFCCFFLTSWQIWCTWWRWRQNWNLNFQSRSFCHKSNLCTVSKWLPIYMSKQSFLWVCLLLFNRQLTFKTSYTFKLFGMSFILTYSIQANAVKAMVFKAYFPSTYVQKRGIQWYGVKKKIVENLHP